MLSSALKSRLSKSRFLVADSPQMVSLIESYLRGMGAESIHRAADGRAAIDTLNTLGSGLGAVIYDLDLPRLGGLEALRLVRRNFGRLPFLMISANVTRDSILAAAELQVDGYLAKPFTAQQLERRIAALMRALPDDWQQNEDAGDAAGPTDAEDGNAADDAWSI